MSNTEGFEDMSPPKGEDYIENKESQKEKALAVKRNMQELLSYPPFMFLKGLLEQQIEYRIRNELLIMPQGADDVVRRTYSAGEIAGLKIALALPQTSIDGAQGTIDMINYNERELSNNG